MIGRCIKLFGEPHMLICDGNCKKAWGVLMRPKVLLSDDQEDFFYIADQDIHADAPDDPGVYEDGEKKPLADSPQRLNRWCKDQCERCVCVPVEPAFFFQLPDFSTQIYNLKHRQEEANEKAKINS